MRKVTIDDFKNTKIINAQYQGKNQYLSTGKWYNIKLMGQRKRVSVPLSENPQMGKSNGGMEFGLSNFYVEK